MVGLELCQGYKIIQVIGVGNVGTTVLVNDLQEKKPAVLKIYHSTGSTSQGLKEYNMLYLAGNAPSLVKVHNIMYNASGSFVAVSMEDLSAYKTLYKICENNLNKDDAILIARNCARAVAELHAIGVVHGDLASENIMIDPASKDVKLIDLDLASKEGSTAHAAGNLDFVPAFMFEAITDGTKIETNVMNDVYSLALCCYLLLGDAERRFFRSLSEKSIPVKEKELMVLKDDFPGSEVVNKMLTGKIGATEAAESLNNLILEQIEM